MRRSYINLPLVLGPSGAFPVIFAGLLYLHDVRAIFILGLDIELVKFITVYSVAILTFISGLEWGFATLLNLNHKSLQLPVKNRVILAWSNIATLLALSILLIPSFAIQLICLCILFIAQLLVDINIFKTHAVPYWFPQMRLIATIMIVCPLVVLLLAMS